MTKTAIEVEIDIIELIDSSALKSTISGSVYLQGTRPLNSIKEDAVISFLTGLDDQIQTGVVNLNVYVPDLNNGTGILVKNVSRCKTLEMLCNTIIKGLTPGEYKFRLGSTIQTFKAEGIDQHFVNVKIKFELATF